MSKRSVPAVHLCRWVGELVKGQKPSKGTACDIFDPETQAPCVRPARHFVVFAWGGGAFCTKHMKEETTP
jgi:hypothetical protein